MCQIVVQLYLSRFCCQLQRIEPLNNVFYHIVSEMGGMDQILGVVMLDVGFDVTNCNAIVLVAFLMSFAID